MELVQRLFFKRGLQLCAASWFKARQSQPLVLKVALGIWLVSQHGQAGITDVLGDSDSNLAYETQEQEPRSMDFYPLDFKGQISKRKANHVILHLKTVLEWQMGFVFFMSFQ